MWKIPEDEFDGGLCNLLLYETAVRFYIVGSNPMYSRSKVLKIDRSEPNELLISDDGVEYTENQLADLLRSLDEGNRGKVQKSFSTPPGLHKRLSAFGIVGFVKFLEGYSMVFITKRRKVASIGYHSIYKIEETETVSLTAEAPAATSADEQRYHKTFQTVDLSSNFYYSYSYDITHSLQHNMEITHSLEVASKGEPAWRFVWNEFLIKRVIGEVRDDWVIPVIHGYICQSEISVYGRCVLLSVIARRSSRFAGTRFLKRGANPQGHVANEIEVEQILHDTTYRNQRLTSFVQLRGSVPGYWSQESGLKMTPKPPIVLNRHDPFSVTAGAHFADLLTRYGSPICCLNLVKKRETKKHESILTEELTTSLNFLNQFLPFEHQIRYIGFDMARANKKGVALDNLEVLGNRLLSQVGFFCSFPELYCHLLRCDSFYKEVQKVPVLIEGVPANLPPVRKQHGVIRINCVDCLDRTNTAAFVVGKCALGLQVYALGLTDSPHLNFDTDAVRMLEDMFEDLGNVLALQYGGSQLVHRVESYRQHGWGTHSKDWMRTISRYYSNTFSDFDKQAAINLFLGIFQPSQKLPHLWDLSTDYFLHYPWTRDSIKHPRLKSYTAWLSEEAVESLPDALEDIKQDSSKYLCLDAFFGHYKGYQLDALKDAFTSTIPTTVSDYMPNFSNDPSPFVSRTRVPANPLSVLVDRTLSVTPTTATNLSSDGTYDSDLGGDLSDSHLIPTEVPQSQFFQSALKTVAHSLTCPSFEEYYGVQVLDPAPSEKQLYGRYTRIWRNATRFPDDWEGTLADRVRSFSTHIIQHSAFSMDSSYEVALPVVNRQSREIYSTYAAKKNGLTGLPGVANMDMYRKFAGIT